MEINSRKFERFESKFITNGTTVIHLKKQTKVGKLMLNQKYAGD